MKCPNCKKKIEVGARYCNHCAAIFDKPLEKPKKKSLFQPKKASLKMSFGELGYYLFKKKRCPFCGGKMIKFTEREELAGSDVSSYEIKVYYKCEICNKRYSLTELETGKREVEVKKIEDKAIQERQSQADLIIKRSKKIVISIVVAIFVINFLLVLLIILYSISHTF